MSFTITQRRDIQILASLLFIMFLALSSPVLTLPVQAHIEKGSMPDSVAEMEYRILLEFQPEDIKTRNLLGMALLRLNKLKEAETEFRQALKTKPDDFNATDSLGLVLLKQGRTAEALPLLEKAVALNPNDCLALVHLGQAQEATGKLNAAEQSYLAAQINCTKDTGEGAADRKAEADQALASLKARQGISPKNPPDKQ